MQTYSYYIQILFPILLISRIVRTSRRTDLFVEVTNITKGNGIWAHFISTGCFPTQIQLLRPIQKDDVQIETVCCIFKWIRINGQVLMLQEYLELQLICQIQHMFLYSQIMI